MTPNKRERYRRNARTTRVGALKPVPKEGWDKLAEERANDIRIHTTAVEMVRASILEHEDYDEATFPESFPVVKFCRSVIGRADIGSPDVLRFRRAITAIATVTGMQLPENVILQDVHSHNACIMLYQDAQREQVKAANEKLMEEKKLSEAAGELGKSSGQDIVDAVLRGETTYQNDAEFMESGLVHESGDVDIVDLETFEKETGHKVTD